jgi:hypothetical protein
LVCDDQAVDPRWPDEWPAAVRRFYQDLALRRGWPASVITGIVVNAEYLRALAQSNKRRQHFRGQVEDQVWLLEAVVDDGGLVAIRQIEQDVDGAFGYWWGRLEDDHSGLIDQPIDYTDQLVAITATQFEREWEACQHDSPTDQ